MLNGNHNNSPCGFAEQIISYLYDEADANEKIKIESHLANCPTCADEFTAFGVVRSSVLEWREAEFSNLQTPVFYNPAEANGKLFSTKTETSGLWFGGFWKQFTFNPAMAVGALAVLAVCAGLILFALDFSGNNEVAQISNNKISPEISVLPTIEKVKEDLKDNTVNQNAEKTLADKSSNQPVKNNNPSPIIYGEKQIVPKDNVIKISPNTPKNNLNDSARNPKNTNDGAKKTPSVRKKQVPSLIDAEDEEDDSIRLADLFAEVDTK